MLDKIIYKDYLTKNNPIKNLYCNPLLIKRFLNMYGNIKTIAVKEGNLELVDMCIDIKNAIHKCNFNKKQIERLNFWMLGYREVDIANEVGVHRVVIHNFLNNACKRISEQLMG